MRWIAVILFCVVLTSTWAEPDPKKYKPEVKDKNKSVDPSLTDEERKFLREVEAKFGIKSDVPLEENVSDEEENTNATSPIKAPFPAVIAIEIVNDTDSNTKGKRTIDANLGYGYRTNNGYTYTYFGKQPQEKGKFMIYPYSQEDIPPARPSYNFGHSYKSHKTSTPNVEIQPSHAYELIEMNDKKNSYHSSKFARPNYESIKGLVSPPILPQTANPTFYTTYNGQEFSSLSSQFPSVMSNYLVDTSQLLKSPQYQSAGINQDYIRSHVNQADQRVVPVLVLRVPNSYLKKPTAELYSSSPSNYPVSHYLNNVNLQELVNNYFKKIGYSFAPQLMTYQSSLLSNPIVTPTPTVPVPTSPNYQRQNYASPYVNPTYTHADYSGVQYSAVQPVMAKYPSTYNRQLYYVPSAQSHYQQPEQQYEYTYQYTQQSDGQPQYYVQSQYQTQTEESLTSNGKDQAASVEEVASSDVGAAGHAEYGVPQQTVSDVSATPSAAYGTPETQIADHGAAQQIQYETSQQVSQEYEQPKEQSIEYKNTLPTEYGPAKIQYSDYTPAAQSSAQYRLPNQNVQAEAIAYYHNHMPQKVPKYVMNAVKAGMQNYYYQKQMNDEAAGNYLVLSENYPSNDHTLATVLPVSYNRDRKPASVQSVSYVTPAPHKYQSPYRIMVPQTILKKPDTERVTYVNSHSLPASQFSGQEYNSETEYTLPANYSPPIAKEKPSYPVNYHTHKRNVKPEKKSDGVTAGQKKPSESSETKKERTS